ncbi:MAG TPA: peptidoglycan-binding protein [Candidatus Limnocylindrales bacterium]|nr:peptidoglycan-binding protein [Candidatus Limnocylindrales bacterium]
MKKFIAFTSIFLFIGITLAGVIPDPASAQNAYNCKKEGQRCGNPGPGEDDCCESGTVCSDEGWRVVTKSCKRKNPNSCRKLGEKCGNPGWGDDYCCSDGSICTDDGQGVLKYCKSNDCKNEGEKCGNPGYGKDFCCKAGFECSDDGKGMSKTCKPTTDTIPTLPPSLEGPCAGTIEKDGKCNGFYTGLGDVSTEPAKFISSLFRILLAGSGAIALLLIIRAGYKIMTSEGKPEAVQEGRERLIAAIVGLLFLIFALVFLQVIGVDILKIPGITGGPTAPGTLDNSASPVSYAQCRDVLRNGSSGRCVKSIQQILGVDPADGNYDQKTEDAVRKYQTENGLFSDGVVGPCTLGSIGGYTVDPICKDPLDETALRKFQTEKGLVVDGQFGSCTWEALIGKPIPENCKRK